MRLLYLSADPGVPVFGGKGASVHLRSMARALDQLGHEVIVASPRVEPGENELPSRIRCLDIPAVKPRECATAEDVVAQGERQANSVVAIAAHEGVDAIYERYSLASFAGARAAGALCIPLVVEVNAPLRAETARFRTLVHESAALAAERETFAAASRIFAVSPSLAGWLASQPGLGGGGRIEVVGNAPPERAFSLKPPIAEDDDVVVGFAGGLKRWHGIETLLRGFELALEAGARMRLEVVGTGPMEELVAHAAGSERRISALGHLPHERALQLLERWDVGVAPFDEMEAFYFSPLKLFEYMAAGQCPVVTAVGELPEVVEHGRTGVIVPPGDPPALAQALQALDGDRARVRELGERARAAVRERPSWSDNARRVIAAVEQTTPIGARG